MTAEQTAPVTLERLNVLKSGAGVYVVKGRGRGGTVVFGPQLLAEGYPYPTEIEIANFPLRPAKQRKTRMTREERKAFNAAKSPSQRIQEQEDRLRKWSENIAKRKAALVASGQLQEQETVSA